MILLQKQLLQIHTYAYKGEGVEKSVLKFVGTKSMATNKCCRIFFVYCYGQVH